MRAADTVKHGPTGETWYLGGADMERDEVYPCGWPETIAKASDCTLVKAATDEEHWKLVEEMAAKNSSPDVRVSHCKHLLHLRNQNGIRQSTPPAGSPVREGCNVG